MTKKVSATPIVAKDLKPGELFSTVGPDYWSSALDHGSIGERVFIRTNTPSDSAPDESAVVYKIEVWDI